MSNSIAGLEPPSTTVEAAELSEFLVDPISYGNFDWSDPITLDEFQLTQPFRGRHAAPLTF